MSFSIKPAAIEQKPLIHSLLQPYLDELSSFPDEHVDYRDAAGIYLYPYLDAYWQEAGIRFPYLLYSDDDVAGFALVRKAESHWEMAEFYVKPEFRQLGLGRSCAAALLTSHPNAWRIEFNHHNLPSHSLWKNQAERFAKGLIKEGKAEGGHDFIEFIVSANEELFQYYNERAPEYEAFYAGEFPTGPRSPELYKADTKAIGQLLPHYVNGKCIDIACGTGFWLPCYHRNCSAVTLIDQSEAVLAECNKKINHLEIKNKIKIIRGDIFKDIPANHPYDSAFVGFLISHFKNEEMKKFFKVLKNAIAPKGSIIIVDGVWSEEVKQFHKSQSGMITRRLFDGREFSIYKHFFTRENLQQIVSDNAAHIDITYWGKVFFLAVGRFN